jgi:hypothetical protein
MSKILTANANGTAATIPSAQFIDGSADAVQLRVQGHSTQTNNIFQLENSAATILASMTGTGTWTLGGSTGFQHKVTSSDATEWQIHSSGTNKNTYLRFSPTGTGRGRIYNSNSTGIVFSNGADSSVGEFTDAGTWTLGPTTPPTTMHAINGCLHLNGTSTTTFTVPTSINVSSATTYSPFYYRPHYPTGSAGARVGLAINSNSTIHAIGNDASDNLVFGTITGTLGRGIIDNSYGLMSASGAWTLGVAQTNQTHTIYGKTLTRGYVSGGSVYHEFQNRDTANASGGSAYLKVTSFSSSAGIQLSPSSTDRWLISTDNTFSNKLSLYSSSISTEVGSIATSGDWVIGATSLPLVHIVASNRASATSGTAPLAIQSSGSASGQYFLECYYSTTTSAGGIQRNALTQGVQFFNTSDRRVKKDFTAFENQLDKLCQIELKRFNYKNDPAASGYGPIAQDLYLIYPEKVNANDDGEGEDLPEGGSTWSVTSDWSYELIKAVQELKAENDELRARVELLENA